MNSRDKSLANPDFDPTKEELDFVLKDMGALAKAEGLLADRRQLLLIGNPFQQESRSLSGRLPL